jgi:ATP-dependent helicase HepA
MPPVTGILVRNKQNPALGPGRIVKSDGQGRITIRFLWHDTSYTVDPRSAPLERYILFGFAPVRLRAEGAEELLNGYVIRKLSSGDNSEWTYEVAIPDGEDWLTATVKESDLAPLPPATTHPLEQFQTLTWQSPKRFVRRWKMLLSETNWFQDSGGITAFLGARIHPMGHQLYAARRVLWDRVPRFILADEVGLGKTIEAGLIIQALKAHKPDLRVLIITPGSMARQWQTELYLRFGAQAFTHVDGTSLHGRSARDRKSLLNSDNLIVTATALQASQEARQFLSQKAWDIVIIDEAHQFPPGTELYTFFHSLARTSRGLLALSATPSKRQMTSLAGLLALVSPDIYEPEDHEFLARRISIQREVWDRLSFTSKYLDAAHSEGSELATEDLEYLAEQWEDVLTEDQVVTSLVAQLKEGRPAAADELIAYVQEFHRLDHRIIRTRRSTLAGQQHHWSERVFNLIEYDPDNDESVLSNHLDELPQADESEPAQLALRGLYYRVFCSTPTRLADFLKERQGSLGADQEVAPLADPIGLLTADPSPADEEFLIKQILQTAPPLPGEAKWLSIAVGLAENWKAQNGPHARTREICSWLIQHLEESADHQVLLFAQDRAVVVELTRELQRLLPRVPVKPFHHGMEENDLAKVALQFQRNKDCRILVSDELGGEGRNFQNASALVHFDLPWSVSRIEQRIGRLDRVGRGADRPVKSVILCGPTPTERAVVEIHSEVFKVLTQSVGGLEYSLPKFQRDLNEAICRGAGRISELAESLKPKVAEELHDVDEAFELSLDASKVYLAEAQKLAELLNEETGLKKDSYTIIEWAGKLGINIRKQRDNTWEFKWTADELQRSLQLPRSSYFMTGTFDRSRALNDDTQQLFSPGHPLVDALTADLHSSAEGRATVMFLKLGQGYKGRLFTLVLVRCTVNESILKGVTHSPGLILRAQRFLWPDIQSALFELHPGQTPAATLVVDPALALAMRTPTVISTHHRPITPNELNSGLDDVKGLWTSVEEAIPSAVDHIRELRRDFTKGAADQLSQDLRAELSYLSWLRERRSGSDAQQLAEEIEARQTLVEGVRNEQINVEAVAIIVGG